MSRDFIFLQVHVFSQYIRFFFALYTISALYHDFASPVVVKISGICRSYLIQINEKNPTDYVSGTLGWPGGLLDYVKTLSNRKISKHNAL